MRRRRLKKLLKRLHELQHQRLTRDELLLKLGAAKKEPGRAYALVDIHVPEKDQAVTPESFTFSLNRAKLRLIRRREGHYTTWKVNNYAGSRSRSDQAGMSNSKTSSQDFPSVKYRLLSSNRERSTSRPIARHF